MKTTSFFCFLSLLCGAHAMFMRPVSVPVDRLVKKTEAYLTEHKEDAQGWYTLGRIHYLAFVMNTDSLNGFPGQEEGPPSLHHFQNDSLPAIRYEEACKRAAKELGVDLTAPGRGPAGNLPQEKAEAFNELTQKINKELESSDWKPTGLDPAAAVAHVQRALECFDKALALKPNTALYLLVKASLMEQYAEEGRQKSLAKVEKKPKLSTKEEIAALYLKAFDAAKPQDEKTEHIPLLGLNELVSHEAGQAYLKLSPEGPRAEEVKKHLEKLKTLAPGPVTPVVAADARTLGDLFQGGSASFDLTGLGWTQRYPWPGKGAAFLVWDPTGSGHIADGKQLFGFYTWGIFWKDGYQALSMLDDNGDGSLTGSELTGICLWTDANGNGISEQSEVVTAALSGISSINVVATGKEGIHPTCQGGLQFFNSASWTTWDWMAEPKL